MTILDRAEQHRKSADKGRASLDGHAEIQRSIPLSALSVPKEVISEKKPLPQLPPVELFDYKLLPYSLKPWVSDIVERIQCPADFVGVTAMAALGAVIGRKVGIRPQEKTDWTEFANQWALVIGRPGVLKSPANEQGLSPLKRLASDADSIYKNEMAEFEARLKVTKLQQEAGEKAARGELKKNPGADVSRLLAVEEPEEPTLRRYIVNDTSCASLGEVLRKNPNGLLVFRDEMVSLIKGLEREDAADARGFYLTGWNGNSGYTFDRIGRGLNLHIPAVCLSMLGGTQPGRISEYLKQAVNGGSGDDGLIQRFGLMVWPDISSDWKDVDSWPDSTAKRSAFEVFARLDTMQSESIGSEYDEYTESHYLRFCPEGLSEFQEWRKGWEKKLRSGELHPALESHLAKYRKLVPSLALIIHLADNNIGPVSHNATMKALAWSEYLESHAIRAYSSVTMPEVDAAKAILRRLDKGSIPSTFTARDIYRNAWTHLSDSKRVSEALNLLVDYGHVRSDTIQTEGRSSTIYSVIP
jgi:putative DNA primase/helicase